MWATVLDWNKLFGADLASKAWKWFSELEDLPEIKVPRCLCLRQEEELLSETLHTFVGASQDAYGAAVFSRVQYKGGLISKRLDGGAAFYDKYCKIGIDGSRSWIENDRIYFQDIGEFFNSSNLLV